MELLNDSHGVVTKICATADTNGIGHTDIVTSLTLNQRVPNSKRTDILQKLGGAEPCSDIGDMKDRNVVDVHHVHVDIFIEPELFR